MNFTADNNGQFCVCLLFLLKMKICLVLVVQCCQQESRVMSQFAVDAESLGTVSSVNVPNSSKPEQ